MNAVRESGIRPQPRRRRPVWGIVAAVVAGMVLLFGLGFGLAMMLKGGGSGASDAAAAASSSPEPLPCATATVIPAQLLPDASSVNVNVYNSTTRVGLASSTADELRKRGFVVKKVSNDPTKAKVTGVAELRYGPKGEAGATLLMNYFPGATMKAIDRKNKRVDVALGEQYTAVQDDALVAAVLASPSPSLSGPGCPGASSSAVPVVTSAPSTSGASRSPSAS